MGSKMVVNSMSTKSGTSAIAKATRLVVGLHLLALATQICIAVTFVSGVASAYAAHAQVAWVVLVLGVAQAIVIFNPARPPIHKMYVAAAGLVVAGELAQMFVIPRGVPVVHVTVAILVWGFSLAVFIRLLDPVWIVAAASKSN